MELTATATEILWSLAFTFFTAFVINGLLFAVGFEPDDNDEDYY